jgi:hypothetical protein
VNRLEDEGGVELQAERFRVEHFGVAARPQSEEPFLVYVKANWGFRGSEIRAVGRTGGLD